MKGKASMKNKKFNKRGVLFSVVTFFMLLSLFTLTKAFLDRNNDFQSVVSYSATGDKLRYIDDDIISNVYLEYLDLVVEGITKTTTTNINFNQVLLASGLDYNAIMGLYETFVEGTYANLNNIDVNLIGFGGNFTIEPFGGLFELQGQNMYIYTMPNATNYVQSIVIYTRFNTVFDCGGRGCDDQADFDANGICQSPANDLPGSPMIDVSHSDSNGIICSQSRRLIPTENNDKGNGKQFYTQFFPSGTAEIKYGQITGKAGNGIFAVTTSGISANISQLDIVYSFTNEKVVFKGGNISIDSAIGDLTKSNEIILLQE